jgi:GntR family transcriptional regulator / MocR family aminotransferase
VTRALARRGTREIAFEDPGYADQWEIARHAGLRVAPIALDDKGIDVDALAATSAGAVVLTPAHQSPSGVVLRPDRRRALIEWAGERDATILEDDYDAEFRYDREPVGALQGLAPERVAAFGTVSKSLAPGLRLGWVACPPGLAGAVAAEKRRDDHGSPTLDQLALARLIESGRYDKHLRRMRAVYGERREVLLDALRRHAPKVELTGLAAGFHAVAKLPGGVDEQHLVTTAAERSIKLYPMSTYRHSGATEPAQIVLGFGNLSEGEIERGIEAIRDLLSGA